jgi:hypothetical protein
MKKSKEHHKIKKALGKNDLSKKFNLQLKSTLQSAKELDSEEHIRLLKDKRGVYLVDSGVNIYFSPSYAEAQRAFSKLIKLTI